MTLAEWTQDHNLAVLALNDFDEVVEFFRQASHAQYMELAEDQRKRAQALLMELDTS
jgi:hypothetical protein